ncbi:hypothetical protein OROMI_020579 [Orobanche minor]
MVAAMWGETDQLNLSNGHPFGLLCIVTLLDMSLGAVFAKFPKGLRRMRAYTVLYRFPHSRGMPLVWILCSAYLVHKEVTIQFLLWWIVFRRWHISSHVRKLLMLCMLLNYFSGKFIVCMACHLPLFLTATLGS